MLKTLRSRAFILIFLNAFSTTVFSNNLDSLLIKSHNLENDHPVEALKLLSDYSDNNHLNLSDSLKINLVKVVLLKNLERWSEAIEICQKSILSAERKDLQKERATFYGELGNINTFNNIPLAIEQFELCLEIANSISDNSKVSMALYGLMSCYYLNGDYVEAEKYCLTLIKSYKTIGENVKEINQLNTKVTLAGIYYLQSKYEEAIKVYIDVLLYFEKKNSISECQSLNLNIGMCYLAIEKKQLALNFLNKSKEYAYKNGTNSALHGVYSALATFYKDQNNWKEALVASDSSSYYYERLMSDENIKTINDANAKFEVEKTQIQLSNSEKLLKKNEELVEIIQTKNLFLLTCIGLLIITGGYVVRNYKQSLLRQRQEKEILEKDLILAEKEKEQTEQMLEYKKKDIANLTTNIQQNKKWADQLVLINKMIKHEPSETIVIRLQELLNLMDESLVLNERHNIVANEIDAVGSEFMDRLNKQFNLTASYLELAALIRIRLTTKEMAKIRATTDESVRKAKYRLKKKLNLSLKDDLETFIVNF